MLRPIVLTASLCLSSCSYFINSLEKQTSKIYEIKEPLKKTTYCPNNKMQVYSESDSLTFEFINLKQLNNLTPIEKFTVFALLQLKSSPAIATPLAHFSVIINDKKNKNFYEFYPKSSIKYSPLLNGLSFLLKESKSKLGLKKVIEIADSIKISIDISNDFNEYLSQNRNKLKELKNSSFYKRGNDFISLGESIRPYKLKKLLLKYPTIKPTNASQIYQYKNTICNFDLAKYEDKIEPTSQLYKSHSFGLRDGEIALSATFSNNPKAEFIESSPFLKGEKYKGKVAQCIFNNNESSIIIQSSNSRDPGQHLFHLYQYKIWENANASSISQLLAFSRHLFLDSPPRLLYEANRGSHDQIEKLLKLDFPIYHSDRLGKITAIINRNLVIDNRFATEINCK